MRIPTLRGIIDRRLLVNFRCDPQAMQQVLPPPFRPQLVGGYAIGGICLIRLKHIRPAFIPLPWGLGSENAAHRMAVEWDTPGGETLQGVYIPRRDTNSRLNAWAGGSLFPGLHHHATFTVRESGGHYAVNMQSDDGQARVEVAGAVTDRLPDGSIFGSVEEASRFFELGSLGYSDTNTPGEFDGLELRCQGWQVEPLAVEQVASSYFQDDGLFAPGTVEFDHALLMRGIAHEWHGHDRLCCEQASLR